MKLIISSYKLTKENIIQALYLTYLKFTEKRTKNSFPIEGYGNYDQPSNFTRLSLQDPDDCLSVL